jgi:methionyl-tRNA formyltransferase
LRAVVIGQQAFGQQVLRSLYQRGEKVVAVCAPRVDRRGRPDALWEEAQKLRVRLFDMDSLRGEHAPETLKELGPDLNVMAYVTRILSREVLDAAHIGTIEFHPSLLPKHRGRSAINWAIINGETRTGLTVFWPDEGIDTGPILLQREVEIGPNDTAGSLYYDRLFPMGVEALVDSVALVREGKALRIPQNHDDATYEPPCRAEHAGIDWSRPAADIYNLIRGADPQPGAYAQWRGQKLKLFSARLIADPPAGPSGTVAALTEGGLLVSLDSAQLLVERVRPEDSPKVSAVEFARDQGLEPGEQLASIEKEAPAEG